MSTYALPTTPDGKYIDKNQVFCAYIADTPAGKFIHCIINNQAVFLFYTPELEQWFANSGIPLITANNDTSPESKQCFKVLNTDEEEVENKTKAKPKIR